jgi:hypothetical protein
MPNGFCGKPEEWERIEKPLRKIDPELESYAKANNLQLSKNYHNWPERSLEWGNRIKKLIQIYLENEKTMTFNLWLCASEDREKRRFWKSIFLKKSVDFSEISDNLIELLNEGRKILNSIKSEDLKPVD